MIARIKTSPGAMIPCMEKMNMGQSGVSGSRNEWLCKKGEKSEMNKNGIRIRKRKLFFLSTIFFLITEKISITSCSP